MKPWLSAAERQPARDTEDATAYRSLFRNELAGLRPRPTRERQELLQKALCGAATSPSPNLTAPPGDGDVAAPSSHLPEL
jgi:hypothetical protein